jgi:type I restriction enzyme S subunit
MDDGTLLGSFHEVASAPGGIAALRELILDLAVRGRLVEQRADEATAADLLASIERGSVTARRNDGEQPALVDEPPPFEVPTTWCWTTLAGVAGYIQRGKGPTYVEHSSVPIVSQKCVQWSGFDLSRARFLDEAVLELYGSERFLQEGDLLWNSTGTGTVGRVNVFPGSGTYDGVVADSHVTVVRAPACSPQYLYIWLACPTVQSAIDQMTTGTTNQQELSLAAIRSQPVPLPPRAEQDRIVARVAQLLAACDELADRTHAHVRAGARLRGASLSALVGAEQADFRKAWLHASSCWSELSCPESSTPEIRRTILQLAVQGRLTNEHDGDEPVGQLIERAAAEADARRSGKASRISASLLDAVVPFSLPSRWAWVPLGAMVLGMRYGTSSKSEDDGSVPVLRMGNIQSGEIDWTSLKYSTDKAEISKYSLPVPAVLFNRTNSKELVGKTAIYRGERAAIFAGYLVHVQPSSGLDPEYLNIVLNSPMARAWCAAVRVDGINQSNISASKLARFPLPLAPLQEQRRIVAYVGELLESCKQLSVAQRHLATQGELLTRSVCRAAVL